MGLARREAADSTNVRQGETTQSASFLQALLKLRQPLQHLICRINRLGINFIRTLGLNHVDQFFHHVHVRGLDIALH